MEGEWWHDAMPLYDQLEGLQAENERLRSELEEELAGLDYC